MGTITENCPRCGSQKITFDICGATVAYDQVIACDVYEVLCQCRSCLRSSIFELIPNDQSVKFRPNSFIDSGYNYDNDFFIRGFVSEIDTALDPVPDHIPAYLRSLFIEGQKCFKIKCYNASASMFRLVLDIVSKSFLPSNDSNEYEELNWKIKNKLGHRLDWLFDNGKIDGSLKEFAENIREDGNDGVHDGSLSKVDAEDLLDFVKILLLRVYTEPERLRLARERRIERRKNNNTKT